MPARFLLIDGYNLLHAAGMARTHYGPGDLKRCRERLLRYLLLKLTRPEVDRATVVFDARDPPPDRPARQTVQGLAVLFANPGGDADVLIQEWILDHSAPKCVTLVSSDHALQRSARRRGAQFIDSEKFFDRLQRRTGKEPSAHQASDDKPASTLSPAEAARWANEFGDLSVISDEADVQRASASPGGPQAIPPADTTPSSPAPQRNKRSTKRRRTASNQGDKRPSDDLAYWLEVFGDLPEAAELKRSNQIEQAGLEKWLEEQVGHDQIDLSQIAKKRDK